MKNFALTFPFNDCSAHFPFIEHFSFQTVDSSKSNTVYLPQGIGIRMFYFKDGIFEISVDGNRQTMLPGDCLVVCPWENVEIIPNRIRRSSFFHLIIRTKFFDADQDLEFGYWSKISKYDQMEIGEIFKNYHKFKINKSDFLAKLFVQLTNEIFIHEMSQNEMVIHIIDQIMILFAREAQKSSLITTENTKVSQIIEQNITKDPLHHWSVSEMAQLAQLGITAFSERMKMETGLSPINFLIKIRINIAMNLMAHFNYKIGDIAYETGFYSPQHFSLTFKKMTGFSPHKYRKTYYEKQL